MVNLKAKPYNLSGEQMEWVENTLKGMTVEEKVGQLFCEIINSDEEDDIDRIFSMVKPGGLMFRPLTLEKTHDMIAKLQEKSDIPMLIAGNLERGGSGACLEGTYYGAPMQIAATNDEECAYRLGNIACKEGAALGFNWTFEPLLDIDYNPLSPITNTRTFGSEPEKIVRMAKKYMEGAHDAGCAVTCKHWPGDGMDFRDQHVCSSVNTKSVKEWDETYGKNYKELIDAGCDTIMAAHIRLPEYSKYLNPALKDEDILPGSLSYELTTTLLREHLGFNGMVVSDATQMAGFTEFMTRKEAVPACIAAGVDMFLFTICYEEDVQYMLDGVKNGIITKERLDEAVTRILGIKAKLNLHKKMQDGTLQMPLQEAKKLIGCEEHKKFTEECADKAITLVKNKGNIIPISPEKYKRILLRVVTNAETKDNVYDEQTQLLKELLIKEGFEVVEFSDSIVPSKNVNSFSIESMKENIDLMIYVANIGFLGGSRYNRIIWKMGMQYDVPKFSSEVPAIMISLYNPYHLMDAQMVQGYINCYSPINANVQAVVEKLVGKSEFKGISPVDAFCGLWDTRL